MGSGGIAESGIFLHASCVVIGAHGVLLMGETGSGKSDVTLRLLDRGAKLVSDDQVIVNKKNNSIIASAPDAIAGLLEVRGLGIFRKERQDAAVLSLAVQLTEKDRIERLPEPEFYECLGVKIARIYLAPFEASAPVKIEMAVAALYGGTMMTGAFAQSCE